MGETKIQWTSGPNGEEGYTFNPWLGCAKAHTGCRNCYAEKAQPVVMRKGGAVQWGEVWQGGQRVMVADSTWKKPLQWAREAAKAGERRKVFCSSLADVLEVPELPERWPVVMIDEAPARAARVHEARGALNAARARLWDVIRQTAGMTTARKPRPFNLTDAVGPETTLQNWPGLDWLLLTKRPENSHLVPEDVRPLVWLGTSISNQETADEWVPRLLQAEGFRVRFLSIEPLTGPVDLWAFLKSPLRDESLSALGSVPMPGIDWVIVGGESGPGARPCHVDWLRSIIRQCRAAGVSVFCKQLGAAPVSQLSEAHGLGLPFSAHGIGDARLSLVDRKGGDMAQWPEDLRVREIPEVAHVS